MKEYNMKDWSQSKDFKVESYQPSEREFAGMQGDTLDYINRRDRTQTEMANKVKAQKYPGRYD